MADGADGWQLRASAIGLGLLVALGLGELALRAARPDAVSILRYPCVYQPDARTGFAYIPGTQGVLAGHFEFENRVEINALGFYDDEPMPVGEAQPRILAVGDSFTAAMNLPRPEVWTSILERELRDGGFPRADVVNLGIDGTGTGAHAAILERYIRELEPDVVLLAFYANDVDDVLGPQLERECYRGYVLAYPSLPHRDSLRYRDALRARVDDHQRRWVRRLLHNHSYLARLLAAVWLPRMNPYRIEFLQPRLAAIEPREPPRLGLQRWRDAIALLETSAAACDCRFLVVPVPPRSDARGSADIWSRRGSPALETFDVLPRIEEERVANGLAHEDLYFVRDSHLNARGNAMSGRALARHLATQLAP
jgi:lysophospholipase L1-like esterase